MAAIATRKTIRRFLPDPIPKEAVFRLIEAAGRASSAHNRQPRRFKIVRRDSEKNVLARQMGAQLRRDREADGDDPETIRRDVDRSRGRIYGAPVMIVVCLTMDEMDLYPDRRNLAEFIMAVQGTAMAAQNLLLAAHAAGLGACWMCAPLFCGEEVQSALALPVSWQPQGLILLGRPAESGRWRDRKNLAEIAIGFET